MGGISKNKGPVHSKQFIASLITVQRRRLWFRDKSIVRIYNRFPKKIMSLAIYNNIIFEIANVPFTSIDTSYTGHIIIKITTTNKLARYFIRQKSAGIKYKIFCKIFILR